MRGITECQMISAVNKPLILMAGRERLNYQRRMVCSVPKWGLGCRAQGLRIQQNFGHTEH